MKKIKTYNELNIDEKNLIDCFRAMKLNHDQAQFELYSYRLNDLLAKYGNLVEMRKDTQALLFEILEEIDKDGLSIDVSAEELGRNREADLNNISNEIYLVQEYKAGFDEASDMIYYGVAEQILIEDENKF